MQRFERPGANWPAGKARVFYQVFMSDLVSRKHVTFAWNRGLLRFVPERGISINGELQEGVRQPYRSFLDKSLPCPMQALHCLLTFVFDGYKAHMRPLHSLTNSYCISCIIFPVLPAMR